MVNSLMFMGDEHAYKMFVCNDEAVNIYLRKSHISYVCNLISFVHIYTVPSVYKEPDILITDDKNQTHFELIEHGKVYIGKLNAYELNDNEYQESGETKFFIENWLFEKHPGTRVSRWLSRHEYQSVSRRSAFHVLQTDDNNGFQFSFKQTTKALARFQFPISIIAVRKQTQNLNIIYTSSFLLFLPYSSHLSGKNAIKHWCNKWHASTNENINPDYLESCPCTLVFAIMDPDLSVDFTCSPVKPGCHENINAHRCYLKRIK